MKRRHFFASAAAVGSLVGSSHAAASKTQAEERVYGFESEPTLMNVTEHDIEVIVLIKSLSRGWVEFGTTEALGEKLTGYDSGFLTMDEKALRFKIEGLKPGTTYFYKVCGVALDYSKKYKAEEKERFETKVYRFKTLSAEAKEAKLTFWNDTHQNRETVEKLTALHHADPSDVLIWNGDVTNDLVDESRLREYIAPVAVGFATSIPVMYSRGNHDVRGRYARLLSQYAPGLGGAYHYSFRQGPLAAVVLDTGEDKPDEMETYANLNDFTRERKRQRVWLEKAIEEPQFKSAPFKVAIMHIPLFFDQEVPEQWWSVWNGFKGWICEEGRKEWHDLLVKAGIKMIISGHTHTPTLFPANAEHPYVQVTGGGPALEIATVMQLHATETQLHFTMKNLEGKVLFEQRFTV